MALLGNLTGSSQYFNDYRVYNGVATQSLRLNDNDSANVTRSPSSAGDRQTWVWSGWVKRANVNVQGVLFLAYNNANNNENYFRLTFTNDAELKVNQYDSNLRITNKLFRDASAWYHIVCAVDTHQATANNRTLVYVNGEQITDFSATGNYAQDAITGVNHTGSHRVGGSAGEHFDGYMAEVNFIDGLSFFSDTSGTANTSFNINSFGETKNGVWVAKKYTGSYGTNGFRLQFNQTGVGTASTSTIGADTSGNNNHYASTNIVASDCALPDSPENNFATLNPLYYLTASTHLSEGNLQLTHESTAHRANAGTMFSKTGKWYFEVHNKSDTASASVALGVGLQDITKNLVYSSGNYNYIYYSNNNNPLTALNTTNNGLGSFVAGAGDIMQVAYDADSGKLFIGKNNTYVAADAGTDGNPATGDNPSATLSTTIDYIPFVGTYNNEATANFGQDDTFAGAISSAGNTDGNGRGVFKYAPPSGYLALCSANLPEPTIGPNSATQADDHFNTVLWTGDGQSGQAITGVGFKPDWVWIKERNSTSSHALYDSSRGVKKQLESNNTDAETNYDSNLLSFDTDGVTLGGSGATNQNNNTFVGWNWKANGGTTSSNSDGSITSTVQANTTAGFSIVTYTGAGSAGTVGHGLGAVPKWLIVRNRTEAYNWKVYHAGNTSAPETDYLVLDNTDATADNVTHWADTAPTSTVFSLGTSNALIKNTKTFVAYCFADVEGYSKFGSYTGNGNADGAFVYTGFRPAFIIYKKTSDTGNWGMLDNTRSTSNLTQAWVASNLANAETNESARALDFLSNGFKARGTNADLNTSGGTYIYMAFAEAPFKYANAR